MVDRPAGGSSNGGVLAIPGDGGQQLRRWDGGAVAPAGCDTRERGGNASGGAGEEWWRRLQRGAAARCIGGGGMMRDGRQRGRKEERAAGPVHL